MSNEKIARERQRRLELGAALPVTSWLPGETLFSLVGRHHIVACNRTAAATCMQLFGHVRSGRQHDVPSNLDAFVGRTEGQFGDIEEIISNHTVLPFYFPFISSDRLASVMMSLRRPMKSSLKYPIGMLGDKFSGRHPLKMCPACIKTDLQIFQVAYWHLAHQFPGVWICLSHRCRLLELAPTEFSSNLHPFPMPRDSHVEHAVSFDDDAATLDFDRRPLTRIARVSLSLASRLPVEALNIEKIGWLYRLKLGAMGFNRQKNTKVPPECVASILQETAVLREISEMSPFPGTTSDAEKFVCRITWEPVRRMHPMWHLFAITWLFGTWESFWKEYAKGSET